jgi:hypothetical protein
MKGALTGTGLTKMQAAKAALKSVLLQVPESTHVGLLVFSAADQKDDWVFPLGPRDDARMTQAIDRLEPSSGTPLGAYLKKGADRLLAARARQFGYGSYRLLVVTDGEAQDQNLVERYTPEIMARGITVDVIGVAMKQDHTLATKAHSYRRANDPQALNRALREVFAEVSAGATDLAQAEAFSLLGPLPAEVVAAAIQALANSGNQPIGEKPKITAPTSPTPPAAAPRPSRNAPASPPVPQPQATSRPSSKVALAAGVFVALIVLRSLFRHRNRR